MPKDDKQQKPRIRFDNRTDRAIYVRLDVEAGRSRSDRQLTIHLYADSNTSFCLEPGKTVRFPITERIASCIRNGTLKYVIRTHGLAVCLPKPHRIENGDLLFRFEPFSN